LIHILLCDDDPVFAQQLHAQVQTAFAAFSTDVSIRHCANAGCILHALQTGHADLIFLDLAVGPSDGYAIAGQIRSLHLPTEIVFVTNHPERMPEAFPFRPIGFLPKPPSDVDIAATVDRFIHFYWQEDPVYTLTSREQEVRIPLRSILYFESSAHHVLIHHSGAPEPAKQLRRLDEIEAEMTNASFVRIHKSFLVHMNAISTINRTNMRVVLHNGKDLPISRSRYAGVIERFTHYRFD